LLEQNTHKSFTCPSPVFVIVVFVGCGILPSILAVIFGRIGLSQMKHNSFLTGRWKAAVGLVMGYLSIAISSAVVILVLANQPNWKHNWKLRNAWTIQLNMDTIYEMLFFEGIGSGDKVRWPADAQMKTIKAELKKMLVPAYVTAEEYDWRQFDKISIGNVSESDPSDTIFLEYKPAKGGFTVIMLKNHKFGVLPSPEIPSGFKDKESFLRNTQILEAGQTFGNPPPRTPAFLE